MDVDPNYDLYSRLSFFLPSFIFQFFSACYDICAVNLHLAEFDILDEEEENTTTEETKTMYKGRFFPRYTAFLLFYQGVQRYKYKIFL
jgi:hypothetical protein